MIEQHKPHSKSEVNYSAPEGLTIPNIGGGMNSNAPEGLEIPKIGDELQCSGRVSNS